jgi:hypothetical protein
VPKASKELKRNCHAIKIVDDLLLKIQTGQIQHSEAHEVWKKISELKDEYVEQINEQSWHGYIGNVFQKLVFIVLQNYINDLAKKEPYKNVSLLTESQLESNDYLSKKISVRYGNKICILPDTDMAIVDFDLADPWSSEVIAIISCKTSLRERIAQACYWKLKLKNSETTEKVKVYLATTDNDDDFTITEKGQYEGKSRNRVIAEWELDGIYILRGDFKRECESIKVKQYDKIFNDILQTLKKLKTKDN